MNGTTKPPDGPAPFVRRHIGIGDVLEAVARHYNVPVTDLAGGRRGRSLVQARRAAFYLARELTILSLVEIGEAFGGRDHADVLKAVRQVRAKRETDGALDRTLVELASLLGRLQNGADQNRCGTTSKAKH